MSGFTNEVVNAKNVDFSGGSTVSAKLVSNGQMLIGSTVLNAGGTNINVGTMASPSSSLTIGYSSPNITMEVTGAASGKVLQGAGVGVAPTYSTATYPVTAGTSGNVLTSNGTNFVSTAATSSYTLIQTQTVTAQSQVDFTSGFGSYTNLFVSLNLTPQTNGASIGMKQSIDAGATWATNFTWGLNYFVYNATATSNVSNNASTPMQFTDTVTSNGGFPVTAFINIRNFNTAYVFTAMFDSTFVDPAITNYRRGVGFGSGGANINALRFMASAGTVTGVISVYGISS